jgi:urate oxidase
VEAAFTQADNRNIVATDTVKNTVYILARRHQFASIEEFGVIIAK